MNIALLGYGKMGKEIEQAAIIRGHSIVLKVNKVNVSEVNAENLAKADVVIEFSTPDNAVKNIYSCFDANLPLVVGTSGWLAQFEEVKTMCREKNQTLFYASNYSIGVNLFFKVNTYLAKLMSRYNEYDVSLEEIHHIHKLDAPSGTAITLANDIIEEMNTKTKWVNSSSENNNELSIISKRMDEVPGTHTVTYHSGVDDLSITHVAHNRKGFALGAVMAAEWVIGKKGVFGMNDLLKH